MTQEINLHYRRFIQSKLYNTMEFAEYLSQKLDVSEMVAYEMIKQSKPVFA